MMKTSINTLEDALTLELENLYYGEEKVRNGMTRMLKIARSEELQDALARYEESSHLKLMKLSRIFASLKHSPLACHTNVIDELINESFERLRFAQDHRVQELILINCMERISNYKTCAYESCLRYAEELELEATAHLLLAIVQWERRSKAELTDLFYGDFSRSHQRVYI